MGYLRILVSGLYERSVDEIRLRIINDFAVLRVDEECSSVGNSGRVRIRVRHELIPHHQRLVEFEVRERIVTVLSGFRPILHIISRAPNFPRSLIGKNQIRGTTGTFRAVIINVIRFQHEGDCL